MSYPEPQVTVSATPGLKENPKKPRNEWHGPFNIDWRMPKATEYIADGHRLFVVSLWNTYFITFVTAFLAYFMAFTFGIIVLSALAFHGEFEGLEIYGFSISLSVAIIFSLLTRYSSARYYVFDREHGTVHFPKGVFRNSFVVPFDQVECYGGQYVTRYGGHHYVTLIRPKLVPKGTIGGIIRRLPLLEGSGRENAEAQWSYILQFMDKSKSVPRVGYSGIWIDFFQRHNARWEDLIAGKLPQTAVDEINRRADEEEARNEAKIA